MHHNMLAMATKTRTNPDGQTLRYHYDKESNLIRLTNENGDHHPFVYDGCERLIQETGFDGRQQDYLYNLAGHLIQHHDSDTLISDFDRDALGQRLTQTHRHRHNSQPEERSRYRYDKAGRLIETYNAHQYLAFDYDYDRLGNLQQEHHSDLAPSTALTLPDSQRIDYTGLNRGQTTIKLRVIKLHLIVVCPLFSFGFTWL